jgi:hypothetical protein
MTLKVRGCRQVLYNSAIRREVAAKNGKPAFI